MEITLKEYEEQRGKLEVLETVYIIEMLCETLKEKHKRNRVYREISPENIFLIYTKEPQWKYVSKVVLKENIAEREYKEEKSEDTVLMGIERYAAPEQYGFKQSSPSTDIFAIGVLWNEMLTGKTPKEKMTENRACQVLIQKCCQIDEKKRYQNAEELLAECKKIRQRNSWTDFFKYKKEYQKKVICIGILTIMVLFFWGNYNIKRIVKKENIDINSENIINIQKEDQNLELEQKIEVNQKLEFFNGRVIVYYPTGFYVTEQNETANNVIAAFSHDIRTDGLLGIMVIHNKQSYSLEYIVSDFLDALTELYEAKEIIKQEEEQKLVIYQWVKNKEQEGYCALHCICQKKTVIIVYGVFLGTNWKEYYDVFEEMQQKVEISPDWTNTMLYE